MKELKESIMSDEIVNKDNEESSRNVENSEEAVEVFEDMQKFNKSNKCSILWPAYLPGQIFERFKVNNNFINMVNQFEINKSTIIFKISIVRFLNNHPNMKKTLLSFHFSNNNKNN